MKKHFLLSRMKSTEAAYLCWFFFFVHHIYIGKLGLQMLYWITTRGQGLWCFIDLPTKGKIKI